jgi:hypothetical protein
VDGRNGGIATGDEFLKLAPCRLTPVRFHHFSLFKRQTGFTLHHPADIHDRQPPAFKSHGAAAVGKINFPGDEIMNTSLAGLVHDG